MKSIRLVQLATLAAALWICSRAHGAEPVPPATSEAEAPAVALWNAIKDCSFDQKDAFFAGFVRLEAHLDAQISALTAQRAAQKGIANTKDWDFAMKEVGDARSYLKGTGGVLAKALPETWNQEREKVGQAWVRAQAACAKVKASTTN